MTYKIVTIGARGIPNVEGGAEKNAENLFPRVAKEHEVVLIALKEFLQFENYQGIRLVPVRSIRFFGTDKIWYYICSIWIVLRERPTIIHCQGLNAAIILVIYKMVAKKVVVRYGSADYVNAKWGLIGRLGFLACEWQLRFADAVIAVTPSLRSRLIERRVTERIAVIPNAIDAAPAHIATSTLERFGLSGDRYALSVGRITWQKDYLTLARAFVAARRLKPELGKLVIVGGDDGSGYLSKLSEISSEDVVLTGRLPRDEIAGLYANCAMYLNTSLHEGLSNAILEAISFGAPLVVSDIVENRDLPLDAHHFFHAGDAADLEKRIIEVLDDPARFKVDLARFCNWDRVAEMTMALYDRLMLDKDVRS